MGLQVGVLLQHSLAEMRALGLQVLHQFTNVQVCHSLAAFAGFANHLFTTLCHWWVSSGPPSVDTVPAFPSMNAESSTVLIVTAQTSSKVR